MSFHLTETVICSADVYDLDGNLADPSTSMKITITDSEDEKKVDNEDMIKDGTGEYHYDWNTALITAAGRYKVFYTAIDVIRKSIKEDAVELI